MDFRLSDNLQRQIISVVRQVGSYQMSRRGTKIDMSDKIDFSPVSEIDLYSDQTITKFLRELCPQIPILSEESSDLKDFNIREIEMFWCLDPLDGTRDYLEGTDNFAINLALFCRGRVCWGIIYHPASQELLVADRDLHSVYLLDREDNRKDISIPLHADKVSTVLTSARVAMDSRRREQISEFAPHLAQDASILPVSSSVKFLLLLKSEAQAYVRKAPCMLWDIAPGFLAAEIAGLRVINLASEASFEWPSNALDLMPPFALICLPRGES